MSPSDFWLIRTSKNRVLGPWARELLCEKIQAGELHLQDEICSAHGYWIYLHESEEVSRQLGIVPKPLDSEESTETETETETATATAPVPDKILAKAEVRKENSPTLFTPMSPTPSNPVLQKPQLGQRQVSRVESPSVLKAILFVLILGMIVSLIFVMQLTRSH